MVRLDNGARDGQSHAHAFRLAGEWVSGGVNSACAARRFACEAFAQEPIHHQLGLNLKLGWCGVHDCAGPPSLLARNPAANFGRDWWVVDVAVDRGAIRHDLFPKQSELQKARIKGCYRLGVVTIGPKDIVLEYTVPMAPRDRASDLCEPRRCSVGHKASPCGLCR